MYKILFSDKAYKQLKKFEKDVQERIISVLERVRIKPEHYLTKLIDDPGYKLRVGDYRIIVDIDNSKLTILVLKIGHRRNIYKL